MTRNTRIVRPLSTFRAVAECFDESPRGCVVRTYCSLARTVVQSGPSIIFSTNQYERDAEGATPGIRHWFDIRDLL